jgi:tetratricopeptide (TPR) repeat protein
VARRFTRRRQGDRVVREIDCPDNDAPHALYVCLDAEADEADQARMSMWLEATMPQLSWRSHLYLVAPSNAALLARFEAVAALAKEHLYQRAFAHLMLHPLVYVDHTIADRSCALPQLLAPARELQNEAYNEQGDARLIVSPLIWVAPDLAPSVIEDLLGVCRANAAPPILLCWGGLPAGLDGAVLGRRGRVLVGPADCEADPDTILEELRVQAAVDCLLERVDRAPSELLRPCPSHLVVDEATSTSWPCLGAMIDRSPGDEWPGTVPRGETPRQPCLRCLAQAVLAAEPGLRACGREDEGRRASHAMAIALSHRGEHDPAAELAGMAARLARDCGERAAALIMKGLCLLEGHDLTAADAAFQEAQSHRPSYGAAAYQRAHVELAWRDDIVALEHFAEALHHGVEGVPAAELHFEMALSHLRLEEYSEALAHLELADSPERRVEVAFNRGVCTLNLGAPAAALTLFEEALERGPQADDLSRVLLYLATCHKELGSFDQAVSVLNDAIAADPDELALHNLLGYCYYRLRRHAEAVACYRRAIEIDPSSAIDWANLGSNLRDLGRTDEAIAMYRKALELDPTITFAAESLERLKAL